MAQMTTRPDPITLEQQRDGIRLIWRNFGGRQSRYNAEGVRQFHVVLPEALAQELAAKGLNVKSKPPREDGQDFLHTLEIKVKYGENVRRPPKLVMIGSISRRQTELDEETAQQLDRAEIVNVDLIFNPSYYEMASGQTGYACYLRSIYVTYEEDALEAKYGSEPDEPYDADRNFGGY